MSEKIIHFERGIPGFLDEKEFILLMQDENSPFGYLQSVKEEALSFVVTSPFTFFPDYEFELSADLVERLEIASHDDVIVLTIITVGEEFSKSTANLIAPVIINQKNLRAEQYLVDGNKYSTRHALLPQTQEAVGGE